MCALRTQLASRRAVRCKAIATLTAALLAAPTVTAAESLAELRDKLGELTTDLNMPATPAAIHVGLSGDGVMQAKNRREFEAAATNLLKDGGKPGGTLEFLPYFVFQGGKLPYARYESKPLFRAMVNTTIGLAAGKREIDGHEASANGLSLSTVLVDLASPLHQYGLQTCINDLQKKAIERAKAGGPGRAEELPTDGARTAFSDADRVADDQSVAEYRACLKDKMSLDKLWNRSRISFGLAAGNGHEATGAQRKVSYGTAAWLTVQYGFEGLGTLRRAAFGGDPAYADCEGGDGAECKPVTEARFRDRAQLVLHARLLRNASQLDFSTSGALPRYDSNLLGTRFVYGSDKRNVFVEASRSRISGEASSRSTNQYALGGSFKVLDNLWLNVLSGRRTERTNGGAVNAFEVSLAYGTSSEPLFGRR